MDCTPRKGGRGSLHERRVNGRSPSAEAVVVPSVVPTGPVVVDMANPVPVLPVAVVVSMIIPVVMRASPIRKDQIGCQQETQE